jgi:hypothetical protein
MPDMARKKTKSNTKAAGRDTFQTPAYATQLILPYLPKGVGIWECAAGQGKMSEILWQAGHHTWNTDIAFDPDWIDEVYDFIGKGSIRPEEWFRTMSLGCIVTNPPFSKKWMFYNVCKYYWKTYGIPFALLIPADYSGWIIRAVNEDGCKKIIPVRRIDYITPNIVQRVNDGEGTHYSYMREIPINLLAEYSSSDFHSMWLAGGLDLGISGFRTELYLDLPIKVKKENI